MVFHDGADYWLADGFHRVGAAAGLGLVEIEADIRQGTRRDAVLFSVGANGAHGQRRTNEDKRRAVLCLLNDPEWSKWADREIARRCGVGHNFVSVLRPKPICHPMTDRRPVQPETRKVTRGGTTYDQRVTGINADRPRASPPLAPSLAWSPADIADDADDDELQPEAAAPPPPPPKFDHEAAAIREKAWDAITALSEQPAPEVVIAAWMKTAAPGHPVEKIERAIAWLNEFLPLYREAEPRRWAAELARLSNLKGQSNAA